MSNDDQKTEQSNIEECCSFCGKSREEVEHLIVSEKSPVSICNECLSVSSELLKEDD